MTLGLGQSDWDLNGSDLSDKKGREIFNDGCIKTSILDKASPGVRDEFGSVASRVGLEVGPRVDVRV